MINWKELEKFIAPGKVVTLVIVVDGKEIGALSFNVDSLAYKAILESVVTTPNVVIADKPVEQKKTPNSKPETRPETKQAKAETPKPEPEPLDDDDDDNPEEEPEEDGDDPEINAEILEKQASIKVAEATMNKIAEDVKTETKVDYTKVIVNPEPKQVPKPLTREAVLFSSEVVKPAEPKKEEPKIEPKKPETPAFSDEW